MFLSGPIVSMVTGHVKTCVPMIMIVCRLINREYMDARRYGISLRVFNSISRYKAEHEKRNSISTSNHVLFCLLYKHTNNDVSDDFPKISEDLRKLSEGHTNVSEHFRIFRKVS